MVDSISSKAEDLRRSREKRTVGGLGGLGSPRGPSQAAPQSRNGSLAPVRPIQLYEQIAERLTDYIGSGHWAPGERLPAERELAAMLTVSRVSLREALAALQLKGVVETRHGLGTRVSADALSILRNSDGPWKEGEPAGDVGPHALLQVREVLEPAIARTAALRPLRDARAEELLAVMKGVANLSNKEEMAQWSDSDRLFHRQLGVMTGNLVFSRVADVIASVMDEPLWRQIRNDALEKSGRVASYVADHEAIYAAITDGDSHRASLLARRHVTDVRKHMRLR